MPDDSRLKPTPSHRRSRSVGDDDGKTVARGDQSSAPSGSGSGNALRPPDAAGKRRNRSSENLASVPDLQGTTTTVDDRKAYTRPDLWLRLQEAQTLRQEALAYHKRKGKCPDADIPCAHNADIAKSADKILDALLKDGIKDLPRADPDVVSAKEHLGVCYFHLRKYVQAEDFYRQVLKARTEAKKDAESVLATRQSLVKVLYDGMTQDEQNFLSGRKARDVYIQAVDLCIQNVDSPSNADVHQDVDLGLHFCKELETYTRRGKAYSRLLEAKIGHLIEASKEKEPPSVLLIDVRLKLMWVYVERLSDRSRGQAVYHTILSSVGKYLDAMVENQDFNYGDIKAATEDHWQRLVEDLASKRWKKVKRHLQKQARVRIILAKLMKPHKTQAGPDDRAGAAKRTGSSKDIKDVDKAVTGDELDATNKVESIKNAKKEKDRTAHDPEAILFDAQLPTGDGGASSSWIKSFVSFRDSILLPFDADLMERTRITVIDTGIDADHPFIIEKGWKSSRNKLPLYKDFARSTRSTGKDGEDKVVPVDQDGHGTFIAGLIIQLAPDAEVSIARIGKTRSSMKKDAAIGVKIAEAIEHAVKEWDTDIISMSFGLPYPSKAMQFAIRNAHFRNVILLGAAGNFGILQRVSYPARADGVFKVFAADSFGRGLNFSPDAVSERESCFSILGCDVESIWPSKLKSRGEKDHMAWTKRSKGDGELWTRMSGTSFATPIAAALVAIVYQFHDANKALVELSPESEGLKTVPAVRAVLWKMSRHSTKDGYNFLNPLEGRAGWFLFRKYMREDKITFFGRKLAEAITIAEEIGITDA